MDFTHNHYELFGLPVAFDLDMNALEKAYRELQNQVHPDRFTHLSETERRLSMQWATRVNEAFQTLKKPLPRASYLLALRGHDVAHESNTAMSSEFLMEQMEWREAVEEAEQAGDADELENLRRRLMAHGKQIQEELAGFLDGSRDDASAGDAVRRLMFIEKLRHGIEDALETLES